MFSVFVDFVENAFKKSISKRQVYIRNDKNNLTIHQNWIKAETKRNFDKIQEHMNPLDSNYQKLQQIYSESLDRDRISSSRLTFNNLNSDRVKWNFINEARNSLRTKTRIISLRNVFGDIITNQRKIANLLNYKYSKLGDFLGKPATYIEPNNSITRKEFTFKPISLYECKKLVRKLNSNKPLGPSNIPAWALKDSVDIIGEPLTFLINAFLHEGRFPNHLKRAHVVPIYKSGDIEDPTNYRPISITSALSKVFEKVIQNQIVEFLDDTKLLSPHQFGFRANFSTADALLYATEKIRFDIDNKNVVAAALDLSKAFDSISHEILLQKLHNLNFSENSIAMIRSFLKRRLQKVVLETTSSDWIELYQGVPQGTILGPLLFNIYVNSMRYSVSKPCELVQYADDTFIFVSGKKIEDAINLLEKNAKCLVDFFHRHRLNLNDKKTEFIVFCRKSTNGLTKKLKLKINDHLIEHRTIVKYLGVYLDQNLTYEPEVKHLLKKMACGIKTLYCVRELLPEKICLSLLNALVISHLHYPALLLNGISQNLITTLENQLSWGIKACCNRNKYESSSDLKLKHEIFPVRLLFDYRASTYFWKLQKNLVPAFNGLNKISTDKIKFHDRTDSLIFDANATTSFLQNCFMKRAVALWNNVPKSISKNKYSYETIKTKLKHFYNSQIKKEVEQPEHRMKCWKDYRF